LHSRLPLEQLGPHWTQQLFAAVFPILAVLSLSWFAVKLFTPFMEAMMPLLIGNFGKSYNHVRICVNMTTGALL
jgi:hypothetical protein